MAKSFLKKKKKKKIFFFFPRLSITRFFMITFSILKEVWPKAVSNKTKSIDQDK